MTDTSSEVQVDVGEFGILWELILSSESLQIDLAILTLGLIGITMAYRRFSRWTKSKQINYYKPHFARFIRVLVLPLFAAALITSVNVSIQFFELSDSQALEEADAEINATTTFSKLLNTINILIIGHTVSHIIPILLAKRQKLAALKTDFENWTSMLGFKDDDGDLFHQMFRWKPPHQAPEEMTDEEFQEKMATKEGQRSLEQYRTAKGHSIGTYERLVDDPFAKWKESEVAKYDKYFQACISGNNESGTKLRMGREIEEIYSIDIWREEKRIQGYDAIIPGYRPPGYAEKKRKDIPKSFVQILPFVLFIAVILGVVSWWGVDLFVLATATGGFAIGLGLALQETMQNWFAYIVIRKDNIISEGERVRLDTGYNGYIHKITPRVTYIRHALNESYATIPTRSLINAQIINYTKGVRMVPAIVDVGVSYLNSPKSVAAILVKVGKRVMHEVIDEKGRHLVVQKRCPYRAQNKSSCGCDKGITVDIEQPVVRFNKFNDSSLDFSLWVYVRDYGSQFKTKTDMRVIMYEEFKKYDIRIPWPIRTIYSGDENKEQEEIDRLQNERQSVIDKYGIGDLSKMGGDDD